MSARHKQKAETGPVPATMTEANAALHRLGELVRDLRVITAVRDEAVAAAAKAAGDACGPLEAEMTAIERGLHVWAHANRAALTDDGRTKTVQMPSGTVAWRNSPPSVRLSKVADVIAAIRALDLFQFLRTKVEVDKPAMLAAPALAATVAGVTIVRDEEEFVVEPVELPGGAS